MPWWLLTNYPAQNDVLTILDGLMLIAYILLTAIVITTALTVLLALATRLSGKWSWLRFHHLAQTHRLNTCAWRRSRAPAPPRVSFGRWALTRSTTQRDLGAVRPARA